MPAPIRKYDQLGFPVPGTFEDLPMPDRDAAAAPGTPVAAKPRGASRRKKIILGLILLGIIALAAIPWITDVGQGLLGDWLAQRARERFNDGDMPGTVADSTRAFTLLGDDLNDARRIELLAIRGCAKLRIHDLEGSCDDFDRVLTSLRAEPGVRLYCYYRRSWANCRLKNYTAAVDDATQAIELVGHGHRMLPTLLNQRAYIRALANTNKEELVAGLKDVDRAMDMGHHDNAAFIDTRGYLLHLLGRNDEALQDINRAIDLTERNEERAYRFKDAQQIKEELAVMYHHLGLINAALGNKEEADQNRQRAEENGYNPDAGVL